MFIRVTILLCLPYFLLAQPPERAVKTIDDLISEQEPARFRAMQNHEKYLVYEKTKTGKRLRFHKGEKLRFKTNEELVFQADLVGISDSTLSIYYFDNTENKHIYRTFQLAEIHKIYRRDRYNGIKWGLSTVTLLPLIYDWAIFKIKPWENGDAIATMAVVQAGVLVVSNHRKFFNGIRLNENKRLRVLQY